MILTLPWPPSVNAAYRNVGARTLLSRKGREFKAHAAAFARMQHDGDPLTGRLTVQITAHPPDRRRRDLDNLGKLLLDALEGITYENDSQIDDLRYMRGDVFAGGKIEMEISEHE